MMNMNILAVVTPTSIYKNVIETLGKPHNNQNGTESNSTVQEQTNSDIPHNEIYVRMFYYGSKARRCKAYRNNYRSKFSKCI